MGVGGYLLASACQRMLSHAEEKPDGELAGPTPSAFAEASPSYAIGPPGRAIHDSVRLTEGTVMQSFGFAAKSETAYAVQLVGSGRKFPGEAVPAKGADRARAGDLAITRVARDGRVTGSMYLLGYGHGVQIGVEEGTGQDFIWCETMSRHDGVNGWGTKIARFPFADGVLAPVDWPSAQIMDPDPQADHLSVSLDAVHGKVVLRVRRGTEVWFERYRKEDLLQGKFHATDIADDPSLGYLSQGFTSFGRYLYALEGNMDSALPDLTYGSTYVSVVDWETGKLVKRELVTDGLGKLNREPEGMAVRLRNPADPTTAELCVGFAVGPLGERTASIFARPLHS